MLSVIHTHRATTSVKRFPSDNGKQRTAKHNPFPRQSIDNHRRQLHPIPKVPAVNRHSHLPTNPNLLSQSLPLHESGAGVSGRRPIWKAKSGKTTRRNIRRKTSAQPPIHHPTTPPSQRRLERIRSTALLCRTRRIRLVVVGNRRKKRDRLPRRRFLHQRHENANPADLLQTIHRAVSSKKVRPRHRHHSNR